MPFYPDLYPTPAKQLNITQECGVFNPLIFSISPRTVIHSIFDFRHLSNYSTSSINSTANSSTTDTSLFTYGNDWNVIIN
jgi:hypothetical protein